EQHRDPFAAFELLFEDRLETREGTFINTDSVTGLGADRIDFRNAARTTLTQSLDDAFANFRDPAAEGEKVFDAGRITRGFTGKYHVEPAEYITGKQRRQYPVKAATDAPSRAHPR